MTFPRRPDGRVGGGDAEGDRAGRREYDGDDRFGDGKRVFQRDAEATGGFDDLSWNTDAVSIAVAPEIVPLGTQDDALITATNFYNRPFTGPLNISSSDTGVITEDSATTSCGADGCAVADGASDAVGTSNLTASTQSGCTGSATQGVFEVSMLFVYSDQIPGEVANYLPDNASGSTNSPYILMRNSGRIPWLYWRHGWKFM